MTLNQIASTSMNTKHLIKTLCALGVSALFLPSVAQAKTTSLEIAPLVVSDTLPEGWHGHQQAHLNRIEGDHRVIEESGQPILHLQKGALESTMAVWTEATIPPGNKTMTVTLISRVPEVTLPEENPGRNRFRLGITFYDDKGKEIPTQLPQIARGSISNDWSTETMDYEIPENAATVRTTFNLLNCAGIWEIKDLTIDVAS